MRSTFQNSGMSLSIGIFFSLMITGLAARLPAALTAGLRAQRVPLAAATKIAHLPPVSALFAALLGYNPVRTLLTPTGVLRSLPHANAAALTGRQFFPDLIAGPFHHGLVIVSTAAAAMALIGAVISAMRGHQFYYEEPGVPGSPGPDGTAGMAPQDRPAGPPAAVPVTGPPGAQARRRARLRRSWLQRGSPAMAAVRRVPWWGVVAAAAAPVLLVTGSTVAAGLQPRSFDPIAGTISALAAVGAADRWVMTLAFAAAGACEVIAGMALRPAAAPGRLILMAGGLAGLLVAANPEHVGGAPAHAFWAAAGFAALVAWPGGAWRRGPSVPWGLRPAVSAVAAGLMLGLLAWFGAELVAGGGQIGLAERVMGVAQAGWPLVVVLSCRLARKLGPVGRADPDRCGGGAARTPATPPAARSPWRLVPRSPSPRCPSSSLCSRPTAACWPASEPSTSR